MHRLPIALLLIMLIALAGCSPGTPTADVTSSSPGPTQASPMPTPTPSGPQRFDTVLELSSAAIAAGYSCPSWQANAEDEGPRLAMESGACSDEDVFAIYATDGNVEAQVKLMQDVGATPVLVGTNWTIHSTGGGLPELQQIMGGELIKESSEATEDSADEEFDPKLADFKVTIKVLSKKCFGSAGCVLRFGPSLGYAGSVDDLPAEGSTSVTYEVKGGEDEMIGTLEVDGEGTVTGGDQETIQTTSSKRKLTAKVTDVEYNEFG